MRLFLCQTSSIWRLLQEAHLLKERASFAASQTAVIAHVTSPTGYETHLLLLRADQEVKKVARGLSPSDSRRRMPLVLHRQRDFSDAGPRAPGSASSCFAHCFAKGCRQTEKKEAVVHFATVKKLQLLNRHGMPWHGEDNLPLA